jgi:hypothetical protein
MSPSAMTMLLRTIGSLLVSKILNKRGRCASQNCALTHISLVMAKTAASRRVGDCRTRSQHGSDHYTAEVLTLKAFGAEQICAIMPPYTSHACHQVANVVFGIARHRFKVVGVLISGLAGIGCGRDHQHPRSGLVSQPETNPCLTRLSDV